MFTNSNIFFLIYSFPFNIQSKIKGAYFLIFPPPAHMGGRKSNRIRRQKKRKRKKREKKERRKGEGGKGRKKNKGKRKRREGKRKGREGKR